MTSHIAISIHRLVLAILLGAATSGCSTLFVPYLSSEPLTKALLCDPAKTDECGEVQRFKATRDGIAQVQTNARNGYTERAQLNSISSALAFPIAGVLLYRMATVTTPNGRNAVFAGGLAAGAAYESRNALQAGSPESVYILADARLGCVLSHAGQYRLDYGVIRGETCDARLTKLIEATDKLALLEGHDKDRYDAERAARVARARGVISQYLASQVVLSAATAAMSSAASQIVLHTNTQFRTPGISPPVALGLVKSNAMQFTPESQLSASADKAGAKGAAENDLVVTQMNDLATLVNAFVPSCIRPQPTSVEAFAACPALSPDAPPPSSITTSPPDPVWTLSPGGSFSLVATSSPSGTPWAIYATNSAIATQALGDLKQVTLSPSQTQISATYNKAVAADTDVVLNLSTLGVNGNALPITLKLKASAPSGVPPAAVGSPPTTLPPEILSDQALLAKLGLVVGAKEADIKAALQTKWATLCGSNQAVLVANPELALAKAFLDAVKAGSPADPTASFCKK